MDYAVDTRIEHERDRQDAEFQRLVQDKVRGTRAFVPKSQRAGKTIVLVGNDILGWHRGLVCFEDGHLERAKEFCLRFNDAALGSAC
jgi:hypothetical protein